MGLSQGAIVDMIAALIDPGTGMEAPPEDQGPGSRHQLLQSYYSSSQFIIRGMPIRVSLMPDYMRSSVGSDSKNKAALNFAVSRSQVLTAPWQRSGSTLMAAQEQHKQRD